MSLKPLSLDGESAGIRTQLALKGPVKVRKNNTLIQGSRPMSDKDLQ